MFSGKGEGGIALRGDKNSNRPWESGYELDIDWAPDREHGHIHFPVRPKPYTGDALIDVGRWHSLRIEAMGVRVTVFLDGKQVLTFRDTEFAQGNICLEGHVDGVKYRKLTVSALRK